MKLSIAKIRREYKMASLDVKDVKPNPIEQFETWFAEALKSEILEPNAMFLATVAATGEPSGRIVLLKGVEEGGFVFYTNYKSRKGLEISQNQAVALTFFWAELERQVRIEGKASFLSPEKSNEYFLSRPRESQIGAWASPQSEVIENRSVLESLFAKYQKEFENQAVQRPTHWGGYLVKPHYIEFWQGRENRLHDRICYTLQQNENWVIQRLAP
ncbi:pyridoxamine 5'-phosphate oxidase [Raineya orbicola]|uniref:Pyridoxine/pyridoxamine 5'-phosphate oxidase n=1 Tax=Raineya orbicola TaxID=2016530 RepID=A0A2N3IHM9_9BACT|nr:pyridoxamine 5'-phosphate oxidase [Raineya orbicola]PKQ69817.1 pdxH: pyridoxamine 5'-phosphate oxidase [Raineya orbicola]